MQPPPLPGESPTRYPYTSIEPSQLFDDEWLERMRRDFGAGFGWYTKEDFVLGRKRWVLLAIFAIIGGNWGTAPVVADVVSFQRLGLAVLCLCMAALGEIRLRITQAAIAAKVARAAAAREDKAAATLLVAKLNELIELARPRVDDRRTDQSHYTPEQKAARKIHFLRTVQDATDEEIRRALEKAHLPIPADFGLTASRIA